MCGLILGSLEKIVISGYCYYHLPSSVTFYSLVLSCLVVFSLLCLSLDSSTFCYHYYSNRNLVLLFVLFLIHLHVILCPLFSNYFLIFHYIFQNPRLLVEMVLQFPVSMIDIDTTVPTGKYIRVKFFW